MSSRKRNFSLKILILVHSVTLKTDSDNIMYALDNIMYALDNIMYAPDNIMYALDNFMYAPDNITFYVRPR